MFQWLQSGSYIQVCCITGNGVSLPVAFGAYLLIFLRQCYPGNTLTVKRCMPMEHGDKSARFGLAGQEQ